MNASRNYQAGVARVVLVVLAVFFALKLLALMTICGAISFSAFTTSSIAIGVMGLIAVGLLGLLVAGCVVATIAFVSAPTKIRDSVSSGVEPPTLVERLVGGLFAACASSLAALFLCIVMFATSATWQESVLVFAATLSLGTLIGYAIPALACEVADSVFSIIESLFG